MVHIVLWAGESQHLRSPQEREGHLNRFSEAFINTSTHINGDEDALSADVFLSHLQVHSYNQLCTTHRTQAKSVCMLQSGLMQAAFSPELCKQEAVLGWISCICIPLAKQLISYIQSPWEMNISFLLFCFCYNCVRHLKLFDCLLNQQNTSSILLLIPVV